MIFSRPKPQYCLSLITLVIMCLAVSQALAQDIPAEIGAQITARVLTVDGGLVERQITVSGQSPDDLFTYWIGFDGNQYLGYDQFSGIWVPGPVTYHYGKLTFQGGIIEGWVRKFAGLPDYYRFFGDDGVLYERYNNYFDADNSYAYYVNTVNGERSDADEILSYLRHNPAWAAIAIEEQRIQAEAIRERVNNIGGGIANWKIVAHAPPAMLPGTPVSSSNSNTQMTTLPPGAPSLLELIEDEIGPLNPEESGTDNSKTN